MGWMGWSAGVALRTDVNLVILALDSRSDLINMIFGDGKKRQRGKKKKLGPSDFKAWAAEQNARRGKD
jgi:hypothetical protein